MFPQGLTAEKFCEYVDLFAVVYNVDPATPEIVKIKEDADVIIGDGTAAWYLSKLNPAEEVTRKGTTIVIRESHFSRVLRPVTIARSLVPDLDTVITCVTVDSAGTHLWNDTGKLVTIKDGRLQGSYSLGARKAALLMRQFTGLEFNVREHADSTIYLLATRTDDGSWKLDVVPHRSAC